MVNYQSLQIFFFNIYFNIIKIMEISLNKKKNDEIILSQKNYKINIIFETKIIVVSFRYNFFYGKTYFYLIIYLFEILKIL